MSFEFKAKDLVKCAFFGDEVFELEDNVVASDYPVLFFTKNGVEYSFTKDGRNFHAHTNPVLTLVERPNRKVTKMVEYWGNIYPQGECAAHASKEEADGYATGGRIACVKLTGSYEVEE